MAVAAPQMARLARFRIAPTPSGLFELAFFVIAWSAHPSPRAMAEHAIDLPLANRDFLYQLSSAPPGC